MTHRERIQEAERAVIEAVREFMKPIPRERLNEWHQGVEITTFGAEALNKLEVVADALLALEAATCPKCDGTGQTNAAKGRGIILRPCPAACDNGRVRP